MTLLERLLNNDLDNSYNEEELINVFLKHRLSLTYWMPSCLKSNFNCIKSSLETDPTSLSLIDDSILSEEDQDEIADILIRHGYTLFNIDRHHFLASNKKFILASIQKNIHSIANAKYEMIYDIDIFRYLVKHRYHFTDNDLSNVPLTILQDPELMNYCFNRFKNILYNTNSKIFITRFNKILNDSFNKTPTIADFNKTIMSIGQGEWEKEKHKHRELYENVFGKICSRLKNNKSGDVLTKLDFITVTKDENFAGLLEAMKGFLKDDYQLLEKAMIAYFYDNKDTLAVNEISRLSSLYVSKAKDNCINEFVRNKQQFFLIDFFQVRRENSVVKKLLDNRVQKSKFKQMYRENNKEVLDFLKSIYPEEKKHIVDKKTYDDMLEGFIRYEASDLDHIIKEPDNYRKYKRYLKAQKLLYRLNRGYIRYDGPEMSSYRNIIKYDGTKYVYSGISFDNQTIRKCEIYDEKIRIFANIKRQIMERVLSLPIAENDVTDYMIERVARDLPFTDEYFVFDKKAFFEDATLGRLITICTIKEYNVKSLVNDDSYRLIYSLFIDNYLIWLLLMETFTADYDLVHNGISKLDVCEIFNCMPKICGFIDNKQKMDFYKVYLIKKILENANGQMIAVLGKEIILKIINSYEYTTSATFTRVLKAFNLACKMVKRNSATVPYISGSTENYQYSMYDSQDLHYLVCGIDTDSCFRITGNDDTFLHYCALDKNGFVIKITNKKGEFIGRAAGFRNGNCLFINQLRTIYDIGLVGYDSHDQSEKNEIIEVFKKACEDIIQTSHANSQEKVKIDHVFVTKSYILSEYPCKVDSEKCVISDYPMDVLSQDWLNFMKMVPDFPEKEREGFETDYGMYDVICIASIKNSEDIGNEDFTFQDVEPVYTRKRSKIIVTNNIDDSIIEKVNRIVAIAEYYKIRAFYHSDIPQTATVFIGDKWYMVYDKGYIIDGCCLTLDEESMKEYKIVYDILLNSFANYKDISAITEKIKKLDLNNH